MKRTALVTGANGAIGTALVRRLIEHGYAVRALVRGTRDCHAVLPESVEVVRGDITDRALMRRAVKDVNVVFHLAAKLHINNPPPGARAEYVRVNVEGTRALVEAARCERSVNRFIFFSTINVYGATRHGQVFDDDAPLNPDSLYAETKARGEEIVRETCDGVVLRVAAVYGAHMKGNFPRLLNTLRKRRPVIVGDGLNRRTLIYTEDLCHAAILAAERTESGGQTYNVTDGQLHTLREIINAMSDALGQPPPRLRLPKSPIRFAAGVLEDSFHLIGKDAPICRATIDKLTEDVAVTCGKIQRELGYRPQYDLRTGWRETVGNS
jgi:UDP-glucose 4-epimerase